MTDIDGHVYLTARIGDYEWMAENLNVTTYNTGEEIPILNGNDEWPALNTGAYCIR